MSRSRAVWISNSVWSVLEIIPYNSCGITQGQVVEGRYIPTQCRQPHHKMAAVAATASPRLPHHSPAAAGS
ncbi:hypothetical protein EYF80_012972 [Liparis tanakae]|uniref:Uncharacterized protein n=1 Tax=Liparis tanakae TaxID=230148 RepID=A0A4Z2IHQ5_9TELE|nr:hypothetical protein EYF80_012972 [Liparis tanakae]